MVEIEEELIDRQQQDEISIEEFVSGFVDYTGISGYDQRKTELHEDYRRADFRAAGTWNKDLILEVSSMFIFYLKTIRFADHE